jgi:hypothetical protein
MRYDVSSNGVREVRFWVITLDRFVPKVPTKEELKVRYNEIEI